MTVDTTTSPSWKNKTTDQSQEVEALLRKHFDQADCYRYNSASLRVRVIDRRFESLSREQRDSMVEKYLDLLPAEIQKDIVALFTFAPSELIQKASTFREFLLNSEFEDPSPSML